MGGADNPAKRRIRQRRYWLLKGWAKRRERKLEAQKAHTLAQLEELEQEERTLGLS